MQTVQLGQSQLQVSRLAYGCMRIAADRATGERAIHAAVDAGYTLFDHADIYADGRSESLFGDVLRRSPGLREALLLQSKCGIRDNPKRYEFSPAYIIDSVDGSLSRLGIEQLDILLLHRPDYLMAAADVAAAFEALAATGKVANFGVSNFSASQLELLQAAVLQPLLVNQVEINLHNTDALGNGVLDQCQQRQITPQAWCPLASVAYPAWGDTLSSADKERIDAELARQAERYGCEPTTVVLAWLLRHPAGIMPIIGSTNPERIAAATTAAGIDYLHEDWYHLLEARNGQPLP